MNNMNNIGMNNSGMNNMNNMGMNNKPDPFAGLMNSLGNSNNFNNSNNQVNNNPFSFV